MQALAGPVVSSPIRIRNPPCFGLQTTHVTFVLLDSALTNDVSK